MSYIDIPGEHYAIDRETLKIINTETGRERRAHNGQIRLSKKGKSRCMSVARLLYCALRGLRYEDISDSRIYVLLQGGELVVKNTSDFHRYCREHRKETETSVKVYREQAKITEMMIDALDTGDYSKILVEIYSNRDELIQFARHAHNCKWAEDITDRTLFSFADLVTKNKIIIYGDLMNPLKKMCTNYIRESRRKIKQFKHDNFRSE